MNRLTIFLLGLFVVSTSAGCGGEDAPQPDTAAEGNPSADAAVAIPDFVIPAPGGALRVVMHTEAQLIIDYPSAELERVAAFYDEWTASQTESFTRIEGDPEESFFWSNDEVEQGARSILVVRAGPGDKAFVGVTLTAS